MLHHTSRLVPSLFALAALALALPRPQSGTKLAELPREVPARWGIALEAEEPFHAPGSILNARLTLANGSTSDAGYWTPVGGGNGCTYRLELLDPAGRAVWQPGSIVGGAYQPPGCTFGARPGVLPAGEEQLTRLAIPLVYQNGNGLGLQGAPLAPGFYHLAVEVQHIGPVRPPASFGPGLTYSARLPILIE